MQGSAPFVGRENELQLLVRAAERVRHEHRSLATGVVGEAGTGKTRLLSEALTSVTDVTHLRIVGFEPEQQIPLAACAGMFRKLLKTDDHAHLGSLLRGDPAVIAPLEPFRVFEAAYAAI